MSDLQYSIVGKGEDQFVTVFHPDLDGPLTAQSDHPNFGEIVVDLLDGEECLDDYRDLFDVSITVANQFKALSERVTVAGGKVFFDGDEVHNALTSQILRFLEDGEPLDPLVNFFEKVQTNPNDHSRDQLFNWLDRRDFTITDAGNIIGYKGVATDGKGGYQSVHSGTATVNGETKTGRIPNAIGDIIEMPRSKVAHDPSVGCHTGLHVGTYDYAKGYASGALLKVSVNPRDVVSVPTHCDWAKIRTCRYKVVEVIDAPISSPVIYDDTDWDW